MRMDIDKILGGLCVEMRLISASDTISVMSEGTWLLKTAKWYDVILRIDIDTIRKAVRLFVPDVDYRIDKFIQDDLITNRELQARIIRRIVNTILSDTYTVDRRNIVGLYLVKMSMNIKDPLYVDFKVKIGHKGSISNNDRLSDTEALRRALNDAELGVRVYYIRPSQD